MILTLTAIAILSGTPVDQGAPGRQGSWWVRLSTNGNTVIKGGTGTYTPAATSTDLPAEAVACTTAGGATCTTLLASLEILGWPCFTISVRSQGDTANDVNVLFSPDGTNWYIYDGTGIGGQTFTNLLDKQLRELSFSGQSHRYVKLEGRAAAETTVIVNITANQC